MHSYEWMVSTLLKVIESTTTPGDDFVQKIAIYLLNALSCQVDYSDKQLVGSLGAFPVTTLSSVFPQYYSTSQLGGVSVAC